MRESDADNLRREKMAALQSKFPFTMKRLLELEDFQVVGRQLSLEGYKDWEIMQAACNIVMFYRIGTLGKDVTADELAGKAARVHRTLHRVRELDVPDYRKLHSEESS